MSKSYRVTSIAIPHDLHDIIKRRAEFNHRSLSSEMVFLIEGGLAEGNEQMRNLFKLAHMMGEVDTAEVADSKSAS